MKIKCPPIIWKTDNPYIATVTQTGLVRAISPGYTKIEAITVDKTWNDQVKTKISNSVYVKVIDRGQK